MASSQIDSQSQKLCPYAKWSSESPWWKANVWCLPSLNNHLVLISGTVILSFPNDATLRHKPALINTTPDQVRPKRKRHQCLPQDKLVFLHFQQYAGIFIFRFICFAVKSKITPIRLKTNLLYQFLQVDYQNPCLHCYFSALKCSKM